MLNSTRLQQWQINCKCIALQKVRANQYLTCCLHGLSSPPHPPSHPRGSQNLTIPQIRASNLHTSVDANMLHPTNLSSPTMYMHKQTHHKPLPSMKKLSTIEKQLQWKNGLCFTCDHKLSWKHVWIPYTRFIIMLLG